MKRKIIAASMAVTMLLSMAAPTAYAEDAAPGATAAEAAQAADDVAVIQADGTPVLEEMDTTENTYAADELITLSPPTDLQWNVGRATGATIGCPSFRQVENCEGHYYITLYRDETRVWGGGMQGFYESEEYNNRLYFEPIIAQINESGNYTFTVKAVGDGNYADSAAAESAVFEYTRPETAIGTATDLHWDANDKTLACFTLPEGAGGYTLNLYCRMPGENEFDYCSSYHSMGVNAITGRECKRDISYWLDTKADYAFTVIAWSSDITKMANGAESEMSEILPFDETTGYINESLDTEIAALKDSSKSADEVKADLQALNVNTVKSSMQASTDSYNKIAELEKLYNAQKSVEVKTNINEGVELGGEATIIGAGLNATGSTVTLNIARPAEADRKIDASLRSLLEISMELDGAKTGELDVPVCITLPVPAGASEATLRILHYHADGTSEIIWPKFVTIDGVRMARFSLTSFSDFVFADASTDGDNNNTGDNDNNSNTGTTDTTGVEGFVDRLYSVCLGREADAAGKADWVGQLTSYQISGTKAAYGFIFSQEFTNMNYSNADFVEHLYEAFMGRASDEGGKADWVGKLDAGTSREEVFNGFANSVEFDNICKSYGIVSKDIETFVTRLYSVCLDRQPDDAGLADWANQLRSQTISGKAAASGFVFSEEFTNKNYSNADYVEHLYAAFMGRASDESGKTDWVSKLDAGTSREEVFNGFADSAEFDNICSSYGIVRG